MLIIRNIEETDIEAVALLENQAFSDAWTAKGIRETFEQSQTFIVVAEENERVIGYCIVYYVLDEGEIARIAVDSSCRRQGVGSKILGYVTLQCKEKGITRLLLDVRESNMTARAFYEEQGFVVDGVRKNFYTQPSEHAVLMSKIL